MTYEHPEVIKTKIEYYKNTLLWWAGMDSNHRTQMRLDLQSSAFSHSATYPKIFTFILKRKVKQIFLIKMVRPQGFEPWTHRL